MADNNNNRRYYGNRHLWRKVVGYGPQPKPIISNIQDPIADVTYSLDLQHTFRHRDYFEVKAGYSFYVPPAPIIPISYSFGEYDEGLVTFTTASTYQTFNFNFTFSGNPYVTLNVDQVDKYSNVNPFGITHSTTGAYIGISAPYSGTVRYRAIWAPSYPTVVTSAFTSSWISASAGGVTVSNADQYYSTFGTLPTYPEEIHETAWDSTNNTSDIVVEPITVMVNSIFSSLSALYSNEVHFIVMITSSI